MGTDERVIYLDNAATTFPKPSAVMAQMLQCMEKWGGNPGRGAHRLSLAASEVLYQCREAAASFFGAPDAANVVFTLNTTYALNTAIKSVLRPGDHVLIGNMEHNAVLRPILRLEKEAGITFDTFNMRQSKEALLGELRKKIRGKTRAVICLHASNIVNVTAPVEAIGRICRERNLCFILDGAQSAGILPIHVGKMNVDILCVPGHKGLYGPQGVGMMIFGGDRFSGGRTLVEGGSGIHSLDAGMPSELPEHFEAGTMPTPAAAGLLAGIRWVESVGIGTIHAHETALFRRAYERLSAMKGVHVYDSAPGAVLLFGAEQLPPSAVASALDKERICVRAGYHCAPLAHGAVGSLQEGAVRVSFGAMNTVEDVICFADALHRILREAI